MIKRTALLMTTAFMFVTLPGAAVAGDQDRDQLKDKIQDKLQDGSCQVYGTDLSGGFILAGDKDQLRDGTGDGIPDQDRLRDGSCLQSTDSGARIILSGDFLKERDKDQDWLRDSSCQDYAPDLRGRFTLAGDKDQLRDGTGDGVPDQDRLRDGSCLQSTDVSGRFILAGERLQDGTGDGIPDQLRDGSCLDDEYSPNTINMTLASRQRDKDNIKDKLKDCKGNG